MKRRARRSFRHANHNRACRARGAIKRTDGETVEAWGFIGITNDMNAQLLILETSLHLRNGAQRNPYKVVQSIKKPRTSTMNSAGNRLAETGNSRYSSYESAELSFTPGVLA